MKKLQLAGFIFLGSLLFFSSCKKDTITPSSVYVPTAADVTTTATLAQLQQGRTIFVSSCGQCHGLYSPDSYSASSWQSIVPNMAARAGLSAANANLVLKYVTRGK